MKLKRILALIAVILLVALYGSTLVFSLSDSPNAIYWFKASIFCTVIIPVMLYAYILVCRVFGPKHPDSDDKPAKKPPADAPAASDDDQSLRFH